LQTN